MKQLTTVLPAIFNRIRPGATFMTVKNYINNYNEISHFGLVFHVDYINAVKKAVNIWSAYQPKNNDEKIAQYQLVSSYTDTLNGYNPQATSAHVYRPIVDGDGNLIKGVKWFDGGEVHLWGFMVHRVVVKPGEYPKTRSSAVTLAKKSLMNLTPLHRFRQYKLVDGRFGTIGVEKLSLTHKDLLRELV